MGILTERVLQNAEKNQKLPPQIRRLDEKLARRKREIEARIAEIEAGWPDLLAAAYLNENDGAEVEQNRTELSSLNAEFEEIGWAQEGLVKREAAVFAAIKSSRVERFMGDAALAEGYLDQAKQGDFSKLGLARGLCRMLGAEDIYETIVDSLDLPPEAA